MLLLKFDHSDPRLYFKAHSQSLRLKQGIETLWDMWKLLGIGNPPYSHVLKRTSAFVWSKSTERGGGIAGSSGDEN